MCCFLALDILQNHGTTLHLAAGSKWDGPDKLRFLLDNGIDVNTQRKVRLSFCSDKGNLQQCHIRQCNIFLIRWTVCKMYFSFYKGGQMTAAPHMNKLHMRTHLLGGFVQVLLLALTLFKVCERKGQFSLNERDKRTEV